MSRTLRGVLLFTGVELATLVLWGVILDLGKGLPFRTQLLAATVLAVGLFVEHLISVNVGRERENLIDTSD